MAAVLNIVIDQGATYDNDLTIANANGNVFNLTNYTVESQIRKHPNSPTITDTFNIQILDAINGDVRIILSKEQTSLIESGLYHYDLKITNTITGVADRIIEGTITVTPSVTK